MRALPTTEESESVEGREVMPPSAPRRSEGVVRHLPTVEWVVVWLAAVASWGRLVVSLWHVHDLGFDVQIYARAARAVAHGVSPYSVSEFVYPPSCALFVRPLAWVPAASVPRVGLVVNAVAVLLLSVVAGRAAGDRWFGKRSALVLLLLTLTPPARAVLSLGNLSALMALGFTIFVLLAGRDRWVRAGLVLGLTLAIKPMLAPVLIVFALERRWKALGAALALPVTLIAGAALTVREPSRFLSQSVPFLSGGGEQGFDAYNAAIGAVFRTLGWPAALGWVARLLVAAAIVLCLAMVQRIESDTRNRVVTTATLLMAGTMLVGALGEDHYVLVLVPLLATVGVAGSYLRW